MTEVSVIIGPETVRSYKRLAYETWWAIAEFIDNSSQNYMSNRDALDAAYKGEDGRFEVLLNYERDQDRIRITDNAMGMSIEELTKSVMIGIPPNDTSGRHEFGMGMKTAACWLGDIWTLRTTQLGDPNEYEITFDVESVANGESNLRLREVAVSPDLHYTVLTISKMHQKIGGRLLGRLKENLRSIYRFDTRSGLMRLCWGDEELSYDDRLNLLTAMDGSEYRKTFNFEVNDKQVSGWAGILEVGGRPKAGFAISRRGRLVMGQPDAWRPQSIFGQVAGSNDLVNQRIVGEIHLDNFLISHTKNQILWQGDELDLVEEKLKEIFADYRHIAQERRVRGQGGPSQQDQDVALAAIQEVLQDPDMIDLLNLDEVPPPELATAALQPLRETTTTTEPDQVFTLGQLTIKLFMDNQRSENDPYFVGDYVADHTISVCINTQHRFWRERILDAGDIFIYTLNCIYDAISEWRCMQKTGEIRPDTVKVIKDSYMRQSISQA